MANERTGTPFLASSRQSQGILGTRGAKPYRPFGRANGRGTGREGGRSGEGGRGGDAGGGGGGSGGSGSATESSRGASAPETEAAATPYGQVIPPSGGARQTLAIEPPTSYTIPTWGYVAIGLGAVFILYRLVR
jgi:hypothetical protein